MRSRAWRAGAGLRPPQRRCPSDAKGLGVPAGRALAGMAVHGMRRFVPSRVPSSASAGDTNQRAERPGAPRGGHGPVNTSSAPDASPPRHPRRWVSQQRQRLWRQFRVGGGFPPPPPARAPPVLLPLLRLACTGDPGASHPGPRRPTRRPRGELIPQRPDPSAPPEEGLRVESSVDDRATATTADATASGEAPEAGPSPSPTTCQTGGPGPPPPSPPDGSPDSPDPLGAK